MPLDDHDYEIFKLISSHLERIADNLDNINDALGSTDTAIHDIVRQIKKNSGK